MIHVGTSGFSYRDWIGPFYPEGTADRAMLEYYSTQFDLVELDYTYYTMPAQRSIESMCRRTPENFVFCVKAHKSMTHEIPEDPAEMQGVFARFMQALEPMIRTGKLGCVLVQFPWIFKPSQPNADYVRGLRRLLPDVEIIVEFRNVQWVQEAAFRMLRAAKLGFCCVDEPRLRGLFPPLALATSQVGYVRFHGRNASKWWKHEQTWERYDYLYSEDELRSWEPKVKQIAESTEHTFVLFNNCHAGQAAINAATFEEILGLR